MRKIARWTGLVLLLAFAGAAGAQDKILFNVFTPPKAMPSDKIILPWIAELNAAGKGSLHIEVPTQSLAPPPGQMDIVTQGIADGAFVFNAFLQKRIPHVQVSLLPMTMQTGEADAIALWRTYERFFKSKDPYRDVVLLGFFAAPGGHLFSLRDEPLTQAEPLKALKMWSLPGYPAIMLKNLGTAVVPGPAVRMYEIVSKGTVDAYCCLDLADSYAFNVAQYAKSMTRVPGAMFAASFSVFMSKAKWSGLSEKSRELILAHSGEKLARRSKGWDEAAAQAEQRFKGEGRRVLHAPPEMVKALRAAAAPLHEEWVKEVSALGVDGKAALEFYLAEAKRVAAGN
jgi:TRAP-type C4-dicarboxylate transport system substrate-binding protein